MALGYHRTMNKIIAQIVLSCMVLIGVTAPASADVAALIRITDVSVTLHRVERNESIEFTEQDHSDAIIKRRALPQAGENSDNSSSSLLIEWFDANGTLVHRESQPDPRFVHAPGGEDVVLPEAMVLIRAPANAVELRVRPRGFIDFTIINV